MRRALLYLLIIPHFCTTIAQDALTDHQSTLYDQLMHQLGVMESEVIDGLEGRDYIILVDAEFGQPDWNSQLRPYLDADESSGVVSIFVVNEGGTILAALRRTATGIVVTGQAAISPRSNLPGTGEYAPQPPAEVPPGSTPPQDVTPNHYQPAAPPIAHSLTSRFELAFGEDSTELIDGIYIITPTLDMVDVVAVRELRQLMNSDSFPNEVNVRLVKGGSPLVRGTKDEAGAVTLRSMMPQASPYGSTITPRPATSPSNSSNRTLGAECTSYQTDNTSGVRCRDSSGHTWGSECTSYQHGNTSGYRCREF